MALVVTDSRCLGHTAPAGYPEVPARLDAVVSVLEGRQPVLDLSSHSVAGASTDVAVGGARRADSQRVEEAICRVHDRVYYRRLIAAMERGDGLIDSADNPLSAGTRPAIEGAVGAALFAVDQIVTSEAGGHALIATRPPGHHANATTAMGFCYVNGVAIAAQALLEEHGIERVAILDFDVHHGNGTQDIFYERSDVHFLSVHQHPFYPGTGASSDRGVGPGAGATLNVPLPAASGDDRYRQVFEDQLLPALDSIAPQALLVSAGFDAWRSDPLGGMQVSERGFEDWGRWLASFASTRCQGRMASVIEGGYDVAALPTLIEAYLTGIEAGIAEGSDAVR